MSDFDENPFGPPTVDDPFADPSVQQVTNHSSNVQRGLEEFNPFADQPSQVTTNVRGASNPPDYARQSQPAVMPTTHQEPQSNFNRNQAQTMSHAEFQRRQEELERKAEKLQRREDELRNMTYNGTLCENTIRLNNWPPLPKNSCGLEPCFYQDINVEINVNFQSVVRQLYHLWIFHSLLMVANVIGTLVLLITYEMFGFFALSIIYALILTPFSFLCWYRPGYKAFRDDSSFNFMVYFFIFFFQFIITVFQAIGLPSGGFCGIIIAIKVFDRSPTGIIVGLLITSIALGFCAAAIMDILLISKIHRIYRSSGASMAKAQAEFTTEFLKNEHVRGAASSAATAVVQSQFQQDRNAPPRN
ncbi:secretory carrier-associated membrane protein 1 isoform X2 [Cimex lectularius]|uniref:Secretory carrier-associated membrane protein n=1 Tax=Cimex lectularius TaxID=79782 RepID=A0A8I6STV3_CIMLE|nr:secretory carrier-associated membrane protein 1 isoform X2 [Cimex lectularius]